MNVVITPDNLKYDGYNSIREYFNDEQWVNATTFLYHYQGIKIQFL